jgi:two-component system, chemotaxis family, sensor kinase CheA
MAAARTGEDIAGAAQGSSLSIGARLAVATVAVLALVSGLVYYELSQRELTALVAAKTTAASMVADLFAESLAAPLDFGDAEAIAAELSHLDANPEVSCAAVWEGDAPTPVAKISEACDASALPSAAELGSAVAYADRVELARVVRARGKAVGKARIVFSLARENAAFTESRDRILWLAILLAAGTAAVLVAVARRQIVLPLARLVDAAGKVAEGDLTARVTVVSRDEIGQLGGAFNRMSAALAERERDLALATRRTRDLLDHMHQAILAFDAEGRVVGDASAEARAFFGEHLEGAKIQEILYGGVPAHDVDAQAFAEWLAVAFDVPLEGWQDVAKLAPKELVVTRPDGTKLPLEAEFRPIDKDGKVDRVMLLATDMSDVRRLEETVEAQVEEHARRMAAMRRLVAGGAHLFVTFTEKAREELTACITVVGTVPREMTRAEVDATFRRAHTMRSEAHAFDLRTLEEELGKVEDLLASLRERAQGGGAVFTGGVHDRLVAALQNADDAVLVAREDFVEVSPVGRAALDQMTVQRSDVEEALSLAKGHDDALGRAVEKLAARRFGESTATLLDMTPAWAEREKKQVTLDIDGKDVRVPPALARVLGGVLVHLVKNAVAHGIETPLERTREGKEPVGTVRVAAKASARGPIVTVEDDGRGLDEAQILARARAMGVGGSASEAVFEAGLSTRTPAGPGDIAGRGVGLDAVREELAGCGYTVRAETKQGRGATYVLAPATATST